MLILRLMLVLVLNTFSACNLESANDVSLNGPNELCAENSYRHKSPEELSTMGAEQLVGELVKEQIYHPAGSWNMKDHDDGYAFLFQTYLKKFDAATILPVLIRYLDLYMPGSASKCDETRFSVASGTLSDIDNNMIRLRAIPEGQLAIRALDESVQRLREAGFDSSDHQRNYLYNLSSHKLEMAKGTNITDEMIRATLKARHRVEMNETEYLRFSRFLTSVDPQYPTWSEVGEYGPPTLVKDSNRYFQAYQKFKAEESSE